ncbi:hypothetical protein ACIQAC_37515 [Streptomyces sp. NPDC088387]|uniref:hypothetical protein n=1 Tax=Streptomyces sp. NPDC088387 TaxID=3365859 RepID=UPI00381AA528
MDLIPIAEAARRLSISDVTAYKIVNAGRLRATGTPARVSAAAVTALTAARRSEALHRRGGALALAEEINRILHPGHDAHGFMSTLDNSPRREPLKLLHPDAFAIFGRDVLEAAAARDKLGGCPTCWARMSASVHQTTPPEDGAAHRLLLGTPCAADAVRWRTEAAARQRTADAVRLADARRLQQAEKARAAQEFAAARQQAETAASRLRTAATAYAVVDPSAVREATAEARRRGAFRSADKWPDWCTCTADVQCARHAEGDRRAARRGRR